MGYIKKDDHTMKEWEKKIRSEFRFLSYVPIVYLSAKTKARMKTLFPMIERVYENYNRRVSTSALNEVIQEAMILNPPKEHRQKSLEFITQPK